MSDQQVYVQARSTGIDTPAAIDGNRTVLHACPFGACLITVVNDSVAAAEIGVALPRQRVPETLRYGERIGNE